jgi:type IV pilus assembly protein PilO
MAIDLNVYFDKISKLRMIHRVIIFVGTIVLLVGLYIWFVHIPKTGEISALKSDLDKLERDISLAKIRTKDLDKLEAELAKAQEDLQFALKLLPTTSEIPSLLKNITKLGNDSNLEFLLFSPQRQVSKEFYVQIPVDIEVEGGYHDVALFFDRIGKLDRIVNVIDVNMAPVKEQNTTLRVRCKATTYRFKEIAEQESEPKKKKK